MPPRKPTAAPRLLAYSHDGYGLGHLRRNLRIAAGLRQHRPDVEIVLATGARSASRLAAAYGIICMPLPPVTKTATGQYAPAGTGGPSLADLVSRRSAILSGLVADFEPDVLLVDRHPRGLHRELDDALRVQRKRRPDALTVLGLRDILDEPAAVAREWAEHDLAAVIEETYDAVFCYGDRAVYDLAAEYGFPARLADRLQYTGYLTDDLQTDAAAAAQTLRRVRRVDGVPGSRLAVCTLGGGQDAAGIAGVFLAALARLRELNWRGVLITGPYMAAEAVDALRADAEAANVTVIRMATDVPSHLADADAVLCMGGYNTTCEVLGLGVPAVIVPRTSPRLEQLVRAQRLAERGLVRWLHPDGLTPSAVADSLIEASLTPRDQLRRRITGLAHDGVRSTTRLLSAMLPRWTPAPVARTMEHAHD